LSILPYKVKISRGVLTDTLRLLAHVDLHGLSPQLQPIDHSVWRRLNEKMQFIQLRDAYNRCLCSNTNANASEFDGYLKRILDPDYEDEPF
jgi:hypothetical protein